MYYMSLALLPEARAIHGGVEFYSADTTPVSRIALDIGILKSHIE